MPACGAFVGMIAWWSRDLLVVDDAPERQLGEALHVGGALRVLLGALADVAGDLLELGDHVAREVAARGTRIGEHGLLVTALRRRQRAAGGEAVPRGRLALQRREVVEQRRLRALGALGERGDVPLAVLDARDDRVGVLGRRRCASRSRARDGPCRRVLSAGWKVASTSQYGVGSKAWISFSRRTRIASVGVCTRPSETTVLPNAARPRIVAARVAFMPTSQSASERERAAASSGRELAAPAAGARRPGGSRPSSSTRTRRAAPARPSCRPRRARSAKISSPSRPASQAFTISSMSSRFMSFAIASSWLLAEAPSARGTTSKCSGRIGRSAIFQRLNLSS